jgi:hypothetical protein
MTAGLFRTAQRRKAKLRLGIDGPSGSGKTYSALLIAKGLAGGDLSKVALIDTEHGSGDLYSDMGPYAILTFDPPYTVQRFVKAHDAAVDEGFEVIIIDSLTHFWTGEGGILDAVDKIAATSTSGNSFAAWKKGTPLQKLFLDTQLSSPCHIIATVRSKVEWVIEENERGKKVPRKVGLAPEQRKDLEYEYTLMLDLSREHIAAAGKDRTGLFDNRLEIPSEKLGAELLAWLEGGADAPVPKAVIPETVAINEVQVRALKAIRSVFSDDEWLEALEQFAARSVMDLSHDDAELMIIALQAAKDARVAPEATEAVPAVAEAPAAPQAATEPPQQAEAQAAVETAGLDTADKAFLQGCDDDNEAAKKGSGTIAAKQLQRLGIVCKHLEDNGIPWKLIAESSVKHPFASRKDLSFEEGRAVILTLVSIEKTLPAEAKVS